MVTVSGMSPPVIVTVPEHFTELSVSVGSVTDGDETGSSAETVSVDDVAATLY
jgi:hypothetical protein